MNSMISTCVAPRQVLAIGYRYDTLKLGLEGVCAKGIRSGRCSFLNASGAEASAALHLLDNLPSLLLKLI